MNCRSAVAGLAGIGLLLTPAHAVLLRLPIAVDSGIHFYYDHDSGSGLADWKCGTQTYNGHRGTDFTGANASRHTPIYAAASGTLQSKVDGFGDGWGGNTDGGGAGNHVVLSHSSSPQRTYYLHMQQGSVTTKSSGSSISCSEQIGRIGTSGNSTGPHLHFEPRELRSGNYVADDPYAGPCGGPTSWWVYQMSGSPTTSCQGQDLNSPSSLVATPVSASQINLNWIENTGLETNYQVERATDITGPWTLIGILPANSTSHISSNLLASTTYFYRVKAFNSVNESPYCNVRWATTSNTPPTLGGLSDRVVNEGSPLAFTATAIDFSLGRSWVLNNFDDFADGTANGTVLFRSPRSTITSIGFLNTSPNQSAVTQYFPMGNGFHRRALLVNWSFSSSAVDPWLRLTTENTANVGNPTVGFGHLLRFDIFTERSLKIALGLRETNTDALLVEDGGVFGPIEFAGVSAVLNGTPIPTRTIGIRSWQNVEFDIPQEPVLPFNAGNGVLESTTGKGVLEHLAIVPNDGNGEYRVWFDNVRLFETNIIRFSLDPGAPEGAIINPVTGAFHWTPTEEQGPGVYEVTVRATDNGAPPMSDTRTFSVTVNEVNHAPALAPITDQIINAGATLVFTNAASDPDLPANTLTFSLEPGAPEGASIDSTNGVFTWTAPITTATVTNTVTVRVTDDGSPPLSDTRAFNIVVVSPPRFSEVQTASGDVVVAWQTFPGKTYRVQYKTNFNQPDWLDLGAEMVAAGHTLAITNSTVEDTQRFYRALQLD
jgi:murein DD-endopeptidase MepM/ murein hydrolase activator NlpD